MPDQSWVGPECGERVRAELLKLLPRLGRRKIEMNERIQLKSAWRTGRGFHNSVSRLGIQRFGSVWRLRGVDRGTSGGLERGQFPKRGSISAPLVPRPRCDCAVTSAVRGGVPEHPGIPIALKTQPLRPIWTHLNCQPSGSIPVSATMSPAVRLTSEVFPIGLPLPDLSL